MSCLQKWMEKNEMHDLISLKKQEKKS